MQVSYETHMPEVVGEFDAEGLHARIDAIMADNPNIWSGQLLLTLGEGKSKMIEEIAGVRYHKKFNPASYDNPYMDGQTDDLMHVSGHTQSLVDNWHMDRVHGSRLQYSPSILTGASIWPTAFLVGRIGLSFTDLRKMITDTHNFFSTQQGSEVINRAIERGDARVEKLAPGEIAVAESGILHKRDVPEVHEGYRYFIRKFPRFVIPYCKPVLSHLNITKR